MQTPMLCLCILLRISGLHHPWLLPCNHRHKLPAVIHHLGNKWKSSRNRFGVEFFWLGLRSNHSAPFTCETCLYIWLIFPIRQDFRFQLIVQRKAKKSSIQQPHNWESFERKVWMRHEQSARQWIEIGNARHSWGSDSYLTTSADVHVVTWSRGKLSNLIARLYSRITYIRS